MSQPAWAAWIEMPLSFKYGLKSPTSQPAWAAWIEILFLTVLFGSTGEVAARMGCVD